MKKFLKFILWLMVMVMVLLVGGHFALKAYLNSAGFKSMVSEQVDKNLHRKAELGSVSYSLLPPALLVANVSMKEKDGQSTFVAFKELSLRYDHSKKEFSSIALREPEVQIIQYADGSFNFSDMLPAKPEEKGTQVGGTPAPKPSPMPAAEKKPVQLKENALPISIALIQIEQAKFIFSKVDKAGIAHPFTLTGLNLDVRNIQLDQPVLFSSSVQIGKSSSLKWTLDLGPLRTLPPDIANMPIVLEGQFLLQSFEDLAAFMTAEQMASLPVTALDFSWRGTGHLSKGFTFDLKAKSPEVGGKNKLALNLDTQVRVMLPEPVINNLLYSMPLPEGFQPAIPAEKIEGELQLAANATVGLLLKTMVLETSLKTTQLAYEQNIVSNLVVQVAIKNGLLTLQPLHLELFGGSLDGKAVADLLAYPLKYSLDDLTLAHLQIHEAVAANTNKLGGSFADGIFGGVEVAVSLSGEGISTNNLRNQLRAQGRFELRDAQKIGTGETFLDRVILKLDHPLLVQAVPEIKQRVEESQARASLVTTTRLDYAKAGFNMNHGVAKLEDFQLGTTDYVLNASGQAWPFEDKLEMKAQMRMSPTATLKLTGDRDLSDSLPYENGGLVIPVVISGSLKKPTPLPDIEFIIKNLASSTIKKELGGLLKDAGGKDNGQVQQGMKMIDSLLGNNQGEAQPAEGKKQEGGKQPEQSQEISPDKLIKGLGGLFNK
ncbi:MAG: hypothetical protein V2A34_06105 [Lentisphaerota bacterium]